MKISFVIPAHNEEAVLGRCLESVQRELGRTTCESEVVVVNNVSTDRTREVALQYQDVTVVEETLKGLVVARRAGYVTTTGELVANIDADTELPEGWLEKVLEEFNRNPNLVALSGPYQYHDLNVFECGLVKVFYFFGWLIHLTNHHVLRKGAMLQGGNFIIRRDAFDQVGGFNTEISFYGEDTDVARRLSKVGKVKWTWKLPMRTSARRLKAEGLTRSSLKYTANHFWVLFTGEPYTVHYQDIRVSPEERAPEKKRISKKKGF